MDTALFSIGRIQEIWSVRGVQINPVRDSLMIDVNGVKGFLLAGDIAFLWKAGSSLPAGARIVEIGSWLGLSAITLANGLLANLNLDARIYCVDTWEGNIEIEYEANSLDDNIFDEFLKNVASCHMNHFIEPVRGLSTEVATMFVDDELDAIFIDGDHSYEACLADLHAWFPKLKSCGRMFGHDAVPGGGVESAVQQFASSQGIHVSILNPPNSHYIWELFPASSD